MARHIYPICRFFEIIFLALLPVSYCSGGGFTTNVRSFVLMLITLFLLLPLVVQANNLFDSQMELAKNGNAEAQFNIGEMYEVGYGVKQDKKQARYWISKSADQKYEVAGFKFLYLNIERDGLTGKNIDKVKELNKMAKHGNEQAQYYLGKMYAYGIGINKNPDVAIDWLKKAALDGVLEADIELAYLREKKVQKKASLKNRFESDPCSSKSAKFLSTCR